MSINQLTLRNLKKNLKNYYLYVFALIFSVVLYFSFVTLQYDPSMNEAKDTVKGAAAIRAGSVLLIGIVSVFLLYANTIFIKRRSKEIGLFQLIGMTKGKIFLILSAENFILYFSSLIIGIFLGFSVSKLIVMIVFKITGVEAIAKLHFSSEAFVQTVIVFSAIYLLIMLMNYLFIKRQTILGLFRVQSSTEGNAKKLSVWEMIIGIAGMVFIALGYYVSSKLFDGSFTTVTGLFVAMISILILVIVGTYLIYKGTVSFIFHLVRKKKDGYLSINEVMSLSSIMFRMKSNALLLTIITTVSALAIGLLSLSYISYYSADQTAKNYVAADFSFIYSDDAKRFTDALEKEGISYKEKRIEVIQTNANLSSIIDTNFEEKMFNPNHLTLPVVSERDVKHINVSRDEVVLTGYNDLMQRFMPLKDSGPIELKGQKEVIPLKYTELKKDHIVSLYFTFSSPVAIVDETIFRQLKNDHIPDIQRESSLFIGIELKDETNLGKANDIFQQIEFKGESGSRLENSNHEKRVLGLAMFIVGFLGLTFLITSGCILYFKQMGESEEEKPNYTILRKLGFTQGDLIKGIQGKQLFSFGIPLVVGLSHSYFAVQSGWFIFGTEVWTPMLIVMLLYAALYSIFGILSVFYYKKIIKEAL
ncbi:ABC transporter permease [Neobacillus sedimentimangrovi]|uniref:ABC transporter permease n=1 Tax=Neobacillus sedimentimangrovi TaxID=2699460 RepID=A0ABS8QE15_9BACI|nr:ABC transporter permease [Neobacillus sedimentimangrovi]MCD4837502.1 ABC transporter permease [Neobacillus sedimentimangrovi]